ncbi:MAG TPA: DegV family protein [Gammaproteobacteria bacterium]|nr:DegV family protein [Gammaproteobacteria bacterium]
MEAVAAIAYVDAVRLRRALSAGIQHVIARQEHLNAINVFPVPDGDTGTNIAFTLRAVLAAMSDEPGRHAGHLLETVASAALDGARGNSGAIFAQFFQGLAERSRELAALGPADFSAAVSHAASSARGALTQPKEGTLLTVMSDFAAALREALAARSGTDVQELMVQGLARAEVSLANTPNQLEVLKKAGVVDAGAQGFVDLVRGVVEFLEDGSLDELPADAPLPAEAHPKGVELDKEYRYCTECLVQGEALDRAALSAELAVVGGSLVVAGGARKLRVHIHLNSPDALFRIAARHGKVSGEKADDMWRQARLAGKRVARPAIVTDSGADIPAALLESLDIHMVPVRVHFGDHAYLDKVSLKPTDFYRELRENPQAPKTSQPPPGDFRREFSILGGHYEAVLSIGLTSRASGTFQAGAAAAARTDDAAVSTLDSCTVSCGQGLLAMYAAECALAGLDAAATLGAVRAMMPRTRTYGMVPDLTSAVRGGRVPRSKKLVADLLHVTPLLTARPDGEVRSCGVLLGRAGRVAKFARYLARHAPAGGPLRLLIGHCAAPDAAQVLLEELRRVLPEVESAHITEAGPALGAHAGPGALVVGLQAYAPPRLT